MWITLTNVLQINTIIKFVQHKFTYLCVIKSVLNKRSDFKYLVYKLLIKEKQSLQDLCN